MAVLSAMGGGAVSSSLDGAVGARSTSIDNAFFSRMLEGATFGTDGYTTRDSGRGRYEIVDTAGNVIGTGYDDLDTTLSEWQRENVMGSVTQDGGVFSSRYITDDVTQVDDLGHAQRDVYGKEIRETSPRAYADRAQLDAELEKLLSGSSSIDAVYGTRDNTEQYPSFFGDANRWEAIGILGRGDTEAKADNMHGMQFDPGASNHRAAAGNFVGLPGTVRGNAIYDPQVDEVKGENALYGSVPVIKDGKLIGYKVDVRLMSEDQQKKIIDYYAGLEQPRHQMQVGDMGVATAWNRRSSATQNTMSRQLNEGWDQFQKMGDTEYFVPITKVGEVPGWKNSSSASYDNWAGGSFFDKLMDSGAILGIAAMAMGLPGIIGNAIGLTGTAASVAGGAIVGGATSAITGGDFLEGAALGGLGGAMSGWNPVGGAMTEGWSSGAIKAANMAVKGGISGLAGAAIRGGDVGTSTLVGAASGAAGGYVGDAYGKTAGMLAQTGTGLLTSYALADKPEFKQSVPQTVTQAATSGYGAVPQMDVGSMNTRQRIAAQLRSY